MKQKQKGKTVKKVDRHNKESKTLIKPEHIEEKIERAKTPQISTYDTINEAVHEYLLKSGLFKTVDSFQQELLYGKSTIDEYIQVAPGENFGQSYLLDAFDKGKKDIFFEGWRRLLPMHIQASDEICHKLEFYIRVYFSIFPMHALNPYGGDPEKLKKELEDFKIYLDAEKATLSQIPELLSFYALPFVGNPHTHVSFRNLFTAQWAHELRNKLVIFVSHFLPPLGPPLIYDIYRAYRDLQKNGVPYFSFLPFPT